LLLRIAISSAAPVAQIINQLHHVPSSDGSYTFAFSSDDGTFRIERRDGDYVVGKYGYIDSQGIMQVTGEIFARN
jgi:hypothetical protein